jgi:hypothetical protein
MMIRDDPTTPAMSGSRRQAGDLIEAVLQNMRQNLEELRYTTVAPSRYTVYLSANEHKRLEGIIPRLRAETIRALTEELDRQNRSSWLRRWGGRWLARRRPALQNADSHWHVEFLPDVDGDLRGDHDLVVHSDLILPPELELGGGERTRRITTVKIGERTTSSAETIVGSASLADVAAHVTYQDASGRHRYEFVRDSTTIGRGGIAYPVDIRIVSSEDVSREHARIRRDPRTGAFFLIDLSTLGTTLNGRHIPRGYEEAAGAKRENGAESALPDRATIGLAETVFLEFEKAPSAGH